MSEVDSYETGELIKYILSVPEILRHGNQQRVLHGYRLNRQRRCPLFKRVTVEHPGEFNRCNQEGLRDPKGGCERERRKYEPNWKTTLWTSRARLGETVSVGSAVPHLR